MRPWWHFVLSFTKHSVQQNPSPLDSQSNLMVLVQWHQKALPSSSAKSYLGCLCVHCSPFLFFFKLQLLTHFMRVQCEPQIICCLYAKFVKNNRTRVLNGFSSSIYYKRSTRLFEVLQPGVFLWSRGRLHHPRGSTHLIPPLPALSWTCIKVAFVWAGAGHAYPYYRVTSGFLAEACKYQKGIICCECTHTPGGRIPVGDFEEEDISAHHLCSGNLSPAKLLPRRKSLWKGS